MRRNRPRSPRPPLRDAPRRRPPAGRAGRESGRFPFPLAQLLREIDGASYGAYRRIVGVHEIGEFTLVVDRVPADPFGGAARMRVRVRRDTARLPRDLAADPARRVGVEDYLARAVEEAVRGPMGWGARVPPGTGRAFPEPPGPAVVERSCCRIDGESIELRLFVDLPALDRRVRGLGAEQLLLGDLPRLAKSTMLFSARRTEEALRHAGAVEDHAALQRALSERGLSAFVGDGSLLARASGSDGGARRDGREVAFESPSSLAVEIDLPRAGRVRGMGIPAGVTLVVGGGFHGKSTLLDAIAAGVRPHPPGDGRERVAALPATVAVRTEPGRIVRRTDVSAFLLAPPTGDCPADYSTDAASGAVSEAASVAEAIEAGARVLLFDEDTSAARFLVRDGRMQRLVPRPGEPIVALADRARDLYDRLGISTILATGGSADCLDAAHTVIRMREWRAEDATPAAGEVLSSTRSTRIRETLPALRAPASREASLDLGAENARTGLHGPRGIRLGDETVDLSALGQITEAGEARALALLLREASRRPGTGVTGLLNDLERWLDAGGLDALDPPAAYDLARPRRFEIAAALFRCRALRVRRPDLGPR